MIDDPSALPNVKRCLDPKSMQALLQASLPACRNDGLSIEAVRIAKARRNSSRRRNPHPLTLCYELSLRDPRGGRSQQQYYGKLCRDGAGARLAPLLGGDVVYVAEVDLLLWPWPADPGLPQLPALLEASQTLAFWGAPADDVAVLRHEPEDRATLRYSRIVEGGRVRLYAKTFSDDRGALIHQRFVQAWEDSQRDPRAALVARPLAYDAATHTVWQAEAQGVPLREALAHGPSVALPGRIAAALARLHQGPLHLAGPIAHDRAHWLQEVRRRQKKIGRSIPALAARVGRLADAIEAQAERLPHAPLALIHGDCHPDQLWVCDQRVVLFDFDEFTGGDPMEDLAAFVTRLASLAGGPALAEALLTHHALLAPHHHDTRRLQWHLTVQQLLQASRAFVFQVPDWPAELERRLARAEVLAASPFTECLA